MKNIINLKFLTENFWLNRVLPSVVTLGMFGCIYYIFMVVPNEKVMGAVQRIFYFHVGSALTAYLMLAVLLIASCFFLNSKKIEWDFIAESSAYIAFLFCTIVLASGMIWAHSAWNVWWRWEPRLVSFLVLWLILFSYVILRSFASGDQKERVFSAILGIVAAVNVPVVIFSIKLLDHREQLHPEVVAKKGLGDPRFSIALLFASVCLMLFSVWILKLRVTQRVIENKIGERYG